jgi:hypothetical protein
MLRSRRASHAEFRGTAVTLYVCSMFSVVKFFVD